MIKFAFYKGDSGQGCEEWKTAVRFKQGNQVGDYQSRMLLSASNRISSGLNKGLFFFHTEKSGGRWLLALVRAEGSKIFFAFPSVIARWWQS